MTILRAAELHRAEVEAGNRSTQTSSWYDRVEHRFVDYLRETHYHGKPVDPPLSDLTIEHARGFILWIREGHSTNPLTGQTTSRGARTVQDHVRALKRFSAFCWEEGLLSSNPLRMLKLPKAPIKVVPTFTPEQLGRMVAAIQARPLPHRNLAMTYTLLSTGMRATELCELRLARLNRSQNTAVIMGKGSKERLVQYDRVTAQLITRYLTIEREGLAQKFVGRANRAPEDFVFLGLSGDRYNRNALRQLYGDLGDAAGISTQTRVSPHTFRHTFATAYLRAHPGHIEQLRILLGHSDLEMVRRYARLVEADTFLSGTTVVEYLGLDRLARH
jgi:integrase/recombinase XerD